MATDKTKKKPTPQFTKEEEEYIEKMVEIEKEKLRKKRIEEEIQARVNRLTWSSI